MGVMLQNTLTFSWSVPFIHFDFFSTDSPCVGYAVSITQSPELPAHISPLIAFLTALRSWKEDPQMVGISMLEASICLPHIVFVPSPLRCSYVNQQKALVTSKRYLYEHHVNRITKVKPVGEPGYFVAS
jgi:hypothetical protein